MGGLLSTEEKKEVEPLFQGFDPLQLASVVWDCINEVEISPSLSKQAHISISFSGQTGSSDGVVFTDGGETTEMPKRVFLEIVKLSSEQTIENYEQHYDLERSPDADYAVTELKKAVECLTAHISTIQGVTPEEYKQYLDEEIASDDVFSSEEEEYEENESEEDENQEDIQNVSNTELPPPPIQQPQVLVNDEIVPSPAKGSDQGSDSDDDSPPTPPSPSYLAQRRGSMGIDGVLDRIPDLRRRVSGEDDEGSPPGSPTSLAVDKVRKKVKLLSLFHVRKDSPEEDEKKEKSLKPRSLSLQTLFSTPSPKLARHRFLSTPTSSSTPTSPEQPSTPTASPDMQRSKQRSRSTPFMRPETPPTKRSLSTPTFKMPDKIVVLPGTVEEESLTAATQSPPPSPSDDEDDVFVTTAQIKKVHRSSAKVSYHPSDDTALHRSHTGPAKLCTETSSQLLLNVPDKTSIASPALSPVSMFSLSLGSLDEDTASTASTLADGKEPGASPSPNRVYFNVGSPQ